MKNHNGTGLIKVPLHSRFNILAGLHGSLWQYIEVSVEMCVSAVLVVVYL
jgi:hypothetical protein